MKKSVLFLLTILSYNCFAISTGTPITTDYPTISNFEVNIDDIEQLITEEEYNQLSHEEKKEIAKKIRRIKRTLNKKYIEFLKKNIRN